jgi:hypothetical protein
MVSMNCEADAVSEKQGDDVTQSPQCTINQVETKAATKEIIMIETYFFFVLFDFRH